MLKDGKLGHYEITESIGAGGMGEVYRAIDTRLQRPVAIKLLSNLLADAEARRRFQREAQVASSLNHPHIVTVHDVGEHEGRQYLVTELVDGGTLADWLHRDQRSWRQVVELLAGVADGLATAHNASILHRDVKPANILITQNGYAKLSDFGLAKLIEEADPSVAPTRAVTEMPTKPGVIMGTIAYMSPEQAAGKPLDARSDVFSFGVVLFEALTGEHPFTGATNLEVLQKILHSPAKALPRSLPPALRLIVEKALEKDSADRYQSLREMVVDLRRLLRNKTEIADNEAHVVADPPPGRRSRVAAAVALVAFAAGVLGSALWMARSATPSIHSVRHERLTDSIGTEETPSISADGKAVAFTAPVNGTRQVFIRLRSKGVPVQVTEASSDHFFPRWADEDTLIYFRAGNKPGDPGALWEVPYVSGTPRLIASAQGEGDVSHDGRLVATFRTAGPETTLVIIDRRSGKTEKTIALPPTNFSYGRPRWSPDDRHIAFEARYDLSTGQLQVVEVSTSARKTLVSGGQTRGIAWLPDGSGLMYASADGSTMAYPPVFSLKTTSLDGSVQRQLPIGEAGYASYVEPDIHASGSLVASRVHMQSDIYRYPVEGTASENTAKATRITRQTGQVQTPSASPDGNEVAYLSDSGGHANVWVATVDGSRPPRPITFEDDPSVVVGIPRWSPGGDRIVYIRQRVGGRGEEWLVNPDGTGHRMLVPSGAGAFWSNDGKWLYYFVFNEDPSSPCAYKVSADGGPEIQVRCGSAGMMVTADGSTAFMIASHLLQGEIWKVTPVETGKPEPFVNLQSRLPLLPHHFDLSPDDHWLATPLKDRGTTNLWKVSTRDASLHQITDFGQRATLIARQVAWSRDSKYIFAALVEMDADIVLIDGALDR